jgi:cephalosporin hydroxylase
MFDREAFERAKATNAERQSADDGLRRLALQIITDSDRFAYGYSWTWLGLPLLQMPEDMIAVQEVIWETRPDVIIETGIAWGGSVLFYASLLQLLGKGKVIAIDLNLMDHVRDKIMSYPFSDRIRLFNGSSIDPAVVAQVKAEIPPGASVMLSLDSNHTHEHVLTELRTYGPMVTKGQFAVVCDTVVEDIPTQTHRPRPWGPGNNPKTALDEYLSETDGFVVDPRLAAKQLLTYHPGGYLRRVK